MTHYQTGGLIAALESPAHRQEAIEIALRWLAEMPPGGQKEQLRGAIDRVLQL